MTNLPGFGAPLTDMYSGYLDISGGKHLHYIVYASQGNPATDPVVAWYNGGPGCSSLEGAFQESGPLWTETGGATLQVNEYSWNKFSTNVFIEAPAGVGFSYADTPAGTAHNDTSTAADNLASLEVFFAAFPEYSTQPFWITGESCELLRRARSRGHARALPLARCRGRIVHVLPRPQRADPLTPSPPPQMLASTSRASRTTS